MRQSLMRRIDRLDKACAARRRTHYLFRDQDETNAQVQAHQNAMNASGEAGQGDQFVIFSWKS
jgi:hypothetical protein